MQTNGLEKIQVFLLFIASSATITILPDILTGFLFPYVGYTFFPFLLLIFVVIVFNGRRIDKSLLTFVAVHFVLISLSCILSIIHGSKSVISSSIFFVSFLIYSVTVLAMKRSWREPFLKLYYYVSLGISLGVIVSFILDFWHLYDASEWIIEYPLNEKFKLKYDKLGGTPYSFPYYLSLVLTDSSKALYGFSFSETGDFTGLSYEASLALLFSTVGILAYTGKLSSIGKLFSLLILILHSIIGLSVTNMLGLCVVGFFLLYQITRSSLLRFGMIGVFILILIWVQSAVLLKGSIFMAKLESRSFEESSSFFQNLFRGGMFGDGIFSLSGMIGVLPSVSIIVIYTWLISRILHLAKIGFIFQASGLLYLFVHSLKFPNIFWQLPFSLIVVSVLTKVNANNKDFNLSSRF